MAKKTVPETSMEQILSDVIDNKYKHQNFFEQVTETIRKPDTPNLSNGFNTKPPSSLYHYLTNSSFIWKTTISKQQNVKLTKYITIPAEFINEQFKRFHRYPIRQRFETMTDYILEMMQLQYNLTVSTRKKTKLKKRDKKDVRGK